MAINMILTTSDKCTFLAIEGSLIDYLSELDGIKINPALDLRVDLKGLKLINSVGVRHFHSWSSNIECKALTFFNCPPIFVYQLNLVPHFLPARSQIESFFVPYYSDSTQEEKLVLYVKGIHFERVAGKVVVNKPAVHDSEGHPMELDIATDRYFNFLNDYY